MDVETGTTTVLGDYLQMSGEEARMDASRRFVAIVGWSPVGQEIRRIDLTNPAPATTWRIEAAAHVLSAPLPLPDGRVVVVLRSLSRRGTVPRRSAELRVLGDVVTSIPLDDVPNAGLAWLGGERVVAGIQRPVAPGSRASRAWDDTSVIVDLRDARVVSVLPGLRHVGAGSSPFVDPGPTNGTVAFIEHNRRIVLRPDLLH